MKSEIKPGADGPRGRGLMGGKSGRLFQLSCLLAALLFAPVAHAAYAPPPDPLQGDGRTSPFYSWNGEIPAKPGQLLRREPLEPTLSLTMAGQAYRILYTSTNGIDGKTPVAVSGALFLPKGTPPQSGWPLIAWAHGTVGVADICAPSWSARSYRDVMYLNTWLKQGYAVVASDYQGLGTPGPHPYLAVRPEAYSVLDSIRAVLSAVPNLANRIVIVGQSQGGGAAFATAGIAPDYAPELGIRGTVATGVPYFTQAVLDHPPAHHANHVDPGLAYVMYLGLFEMQIDPRMAPADLFAPPALPVFALARTSCVGELFSDVRAAGLSRPDALGPMAERALANVLPFLEYTTLKLRQPVFIGTGEADHDVSPSMQLALVHAACSAGTIVEAHLYAGLDHSHTVNASLRDSLPFVRKVLSGQPVQPVCNPAPE